MLCCFVPRAAHGAGAEADPGAVLPNWGAPQAVEPPPGWRFGSFCWAPGGTPRLWIAAGREGAAGFATVALPAREAPRVRPAAAQPLLPAAAVAAFGGAEGLVRVDAARGGLECALTWTTPGKAAAETVFATFDQDAELAAASAADVRWVARSQQLRAGSPGFRVRLATSIAGGPWREAAPLGVDEFSCALAPCDDSTAILATAGASGLAWTRLDRRGHALAAGTLDAAAGNALHVRAAVAGGGPVLTWTTRGGVYAAAWRGGRWTAPDSTRCLHAQGPDSWSAWLSAAPAPDGSVLVAWGDRGFGANDRDVLCAARWRAENGFGPAGEIPGSDGAFWPFAFCDAEGGAWVAWTAPGGGALRYAHAPARGQAR